MSMDPTVKEMWTEALRSGEYRQTTWSLRKEREGLGPEFCCLGVLCDLYDSDKWSPSDWLATSPTTTFYFGGLDSSPPYEVIQWAGIVSSQEGVWGPAITSLIEMNDKLGLSFEQIANYIDKEL